MKTLKLSTIIILSMMSFIVLAETNELNTEGSYIPVNGFVPDAKTAIQVAIAIWQPIYGADKIASEKPFNAILSNGVWHVTGSLQKGYMGGVAEADIRKIDGKILRVIHGK